MSALADQILTLPLALTQSLTWDRGLELAAHARLSMEADMKVYLCDPSSPWQRGTNENTNRLLRQCFPKKTNLGPYTQEQLNEIALKPNLRPRKTLRYLSPAEHFNQCVALTA